MLGESSRGRLRLPHGGRLTGATGAGTRTRPVSTYRLPPFASTDALGVQVTSASAAVTPTLGSCLLPASIEEPMRSGARPGARGSGLPFLLKPLSTLTQYEK